MLRDRVVCGVRDARVQRTLLAKPDLTFKMAFTLAQAAEVAEQNAKDLQKSHATIAPVHAVQKQQSKPVSGGVTAIAVEANTPQIPVVSRTQSVISATKRDTSPRSAVPNCKRKETRTPAQPDHVSSIERRAPRHESEV